MLHIKDILTLDRTLYLVSVKSKKKAFELIADTMSESDPALSSHDIFDKLIDRERLGSTSIGHGVAIPHARIDSLKSPIGCFLYLKDGIDFDAGAHPPVNMIFTLAVPTDAVSEHIELLGTIAHTFSQASFRDDLKHAPSKDKLYNRLVCE